MLPSISISTMGTASPATRSAHAFVHLVEADGNTTPSRFILLGRRDPADPLITRERSDVCPHASNARVRRNGFAEVHRHFVHCARSDFYVSHAVTVTLTWGLTSPLVRAVVQQYAVSKGCVVSDRH